MHVDDVRTIVTDDEIYVEPVMNEAKSKRNRINLTLVLLSILIICAGSFFNSLLAVLFLGIILILLGINNLQYNKKIDAYPEKYVLPYGLIMGGLVIGVIPFFMVLGNTTGWLSNGTSGFIFGIIEGTLVLILGIMLTIYPVYATYVKKQRCTHFVTATCIAVIATHTSRGSYFYEHVWQFPWNDTKLAASDRILSSVRKPYVGAIETIFVNPDNPNDIYRKRMPSFIVCMIAFCGIVISVIGLLLIIPLCMDLWQIIFS